MHEFAQSDRIFLTESYKIELSAWQNVEPTCGSPSFLLSRWVWVDKTKHRRAKLSPPLESTEGYTEALSYLVTYLFTYLFTYSLMIH